MKKTQLLSISIVTSLFCFQNILAQDIHFSQYYQSPLTLNPANAGAFMGDIRGQINYKNQWKSVADGYKTMAASFDMRFLQKTSKTYGLGAGISFFNDKAGTSQMGITQVNLTLAGNAALSKSSNVSLGLQGGFAQRSMNTDKLTWDNQYDATNQAYDPTFLSGETFANQSYSFGDFSTGILWNYVKGGGKKSAGKELKINAGLAYFHLNQAKQMFFVSDTIATNGINDKLYSKIVGHLGATIGINNEFSIIPSAVFFKQGASQEVNFGSMLRYTLEESTKKVKETAISLGGHFRLKDSFVISTLFEITNYAIGLSYDLNTSDLKNASTGKGGMEISLRYVNPSPFKTKSSARF